MQRMKINPDRTYTVESSAEPPGKLEKLKHRTHMCEIAWTMMRKAGPEREHLVVLFLTETHGLIAKSILFSGDEDGAPIYPSIIARHAILAGAKVVAIAHNHPAGTCIPSDKDIEATEEVKRVLKEVGVVLGSSMVIADGGKAHRDVLDLLSAIQHIRKCGTIPPDPDAPPAKQTAKPGKAAKERARLRAAN